MDVVILSKRECGDKEVYVPQLGKMPNLVNNDLSI